MSCTELGFDDYGNLRCSKSADAEEVLGPFPTAYDLSAYAGRFVVRATEASATALLTVTASPTAAGSALGFAVSYLTLLLKKADLQSLPDAADPDDPWVGVYEWVLTDPTGLETRLVRGSIIVEKGVAR